MARPTDGTGEVRSSIPRVSIRPKRVALPLVALVLLGSIALVSWLGVELIPGFADLLYGLGDLAPWVLVAAFALGTDRDPEGEARPRVTVRPGAPDRR